MRDTYLAGSHGLQKNVKVLREQRDWPDFVPNPGQESFCGRDIGCGFEGQTRVCQMDKWRHSRSGTQAWALAREAGISGRHQVIDC